MIKRSITLLLICFTISLSAQYYKTHTVKAGETIESIAKTYLITPFDILALNPEAKTKLAPNVVLIIPNSKVKNDAIATETKELIDYKKHKVKRKETLFSISQKYNVTIEDIKKANPSLYSENLRKGSRIMIPRFKTIINRQTLKNTIKKYTVQPSEGKWRIAYKFGITVQELEDLNPSINPVLQPGDQLNVPNIDVTEEVQTEDTHSYYKVLPKEGFYRLNVKLGLSQEALEALNPELKTTGLKAGMILKVPLVTNTTNNNPHSEGITDLRDRLEATNTLKKVALLLPFRLHRLDMDSVAEVKATMKSDKILHTALDFHSGVLMAVDSAKQLGISTHLKVFDTQARPSAVGAIIEGNDFSEYHAVIGPMLSGTLDRFVLSVKGKTPIFAPLAIPTKRSKTIYQTIPEKQLLSEAIIAYVQADSMKTNVVIIADQKHKAVSDMLKQKFPEAKQLFSVNNKKGQDAYFIYAPTFEGVFKKGKNIVFLETDDVGFGSSVISILNGKNSDDVEIVLTTTDKSKAFESRDPDNNYHLSNLHFHYATVNKKFDLENPNGFINAYKTRYGVTPSKYASRGFDLTLDILLRLSVSDNDIPETVIEELKTEYTENKFRYTKNPMGGYVNKASYIVKYDNLKIVSVR